MNVEQILQKEINKIEKQIEKLSIKKQELKNEQNAFNKFKIGNIEVDDNIDKDEAPSAAPLRTFVGFCLLHATGASNPADNIVWYHLNKNPNVSKDIDLIIKNAHENNVELFVLNDGRNEKEKSIMDNFAKQYNIKMIGDQNGDN